MCGDPGQDQLLLATGLQCFDAVGWAVGSFVRLDAMNYVFVAFAM